MNILFVVNDARTLDANNTLGLIQHAMQRGWAVAVAGVSDLGCQSDGAISAQAAILPDNVSLSRDELMRLLTLRKSEATHVADWDIVMIRTNPARDLGRMHLHNAALELLEMATERGTTVLNHPRGLRRASSKLYLHHLPAHTRPLTLVSQNSAEIKQFVADNGGIAVLKPISGTHGNDVFFVRSLQDPNINQIISVLVRQGPVMVQEFLHGAPQGDTRVLVLNGQILAASGQFAAIRRIPARNELRSNNHAGGSLAPAIVTSEMQQLVADVAPMLQRDGLWFTGLDIIDNKLVEVNTFAPGGLHSGSLYAKVDFFSLLLDNLSQQVANN